MATMVTVFRNHDLIFERIKLANTFRERFFGLMFLRRMNGFEGLLLFPCNSVHTFWMRFSLDLIYLDRERRIIALAENVVPNRIEAVVKDAFYILETETGVIARFQIQTGQYLCW